MEKIKQGDGNRDYGVGERGERMLFYIKSQESPV